MRTLIVLFILVTDISISSESPELIVWNVGQGQWVTYVDAVSCLHFDMGGEVFPSGVQQRCSQKKNQIYLSHWDWDHIGFATRLQKVFRDVCLAAAPGGPSQGRDFVIQNLPRCAFDSKVKEMPRKWEAKVSNDYSRVFVFKNQIIIPGDSSTKQERSWSPYVSSQVNTLILGHHGSRTSTSNDLLSRFRYLNQAISSSRRRKYGHPHLETLMRLQSHGVPLVTTEDWGNVHIQLPSIFN